MNNKPKFNTEFECDYGVLEEIAPNIRRIVAPNPGPFTFKGTGTFVVGHGNVAGVGQALQQTPEFPYFLFRNEQAMVHAAVGYARMKNRLGCYACTTSIGPGATNMVTGAALATINRIPVLLLPGDIFARRNVAPVLQQLDTFVEIPQRGVTRSLNVQVSCACLIWEYAAQMRRKGVW